MRSLRGFALSLKRVDAFEHQIMLFTRKKRGHRVYKGLLFSEISSCCRISNPFVWKMNIMRSTTNKSFRNFQGPDKQTPAVSPHPPCGCDSKLLFSCSAASMDLFVRAKLLYLLQRTLGVEYNKDMTVALSRFLCMTGNTQSCREKGSNSQV